MSQTGGVVLNKTWFMNTWKLCLSIVLSSLWCSALAFGSMTEYQLDTLDIPLDTDSAFHHYTEHTKSELFEGYTIQIFSGDRTNANKTRSKILSLSGDQEARMVYREPNFKIHIGSFPDVSAAERAMVHWKTEFPDAFVLQTLVPWYEIEDSGLIAPSDTTGI